LTTRTPILLFGASGHAKVALDILRKQDLYIPLGVVVAAWDGMPATILGLPVLGTDRNLHAIAEAHGVRMGLVAAGDNFARERIVSTIRTMLPDFTFATAIHPSAQVGEDVVIGDGTVVMAGAVINSATRIGQFCIVNSQASVDHDNVLEDFASLAPGVVTGGNVTVRRGAAIGLGASISHAVEIGEHSVVGAGAVVLRAIPPRCIAFGVPARVTRTREPGEPYL
jgi:sugar O-acyltransferase (sialic acid O-acetyltransferase NeuD family)